MGGCGGGGGEGGHFGVSMVTGIGGSEWKQVLGSHC